MSINIVRLVERAAVYVLAAVPAILASGAVRHFIDAHPAWAVYVPIVASVAAELYNWLKPKAAAKLGH